MQKRIILASLISLLAPKIRAQSESVPVYLDESRPLEQRIYDALSRMTLEEKVAMLHA